MPVFAFLTTEPNAIVRSVHPKAMPVILHPEDYQSWLNDDWKIAQKLVQPFPSQLMAMAESSSANI
jgi:putative SOS response-associated peptidase YedK